MCGDLRKWARGRGRQTPPRSRHWAHDPHQLWGPQSPAPLYPGASELATGLGGFLTSEPDRTSCWVKFMTRHFLGETSHVELLNTPDLTAPNKRRVGRGGAAGRRKEAEGGAAWPDVGMGGSGGGMRRYSNDDLRGGRPLGRGDQGSPEPGSVQGAAGRRLIRAKPTSPPILSDPRRPEGPCGWTGGAWAGVGTCLGPAYVLSGDAPPPPPKPGPSAQRKNC